MEERREIEEIFASAKEYIGPSRVDWKKYVIPKVVKPILERLKQQGKRIKLRTLFYQLISMRVLPATENYYNSLSTYVNEAKFDGILPFGVLIDEEREITGGVKDGLTQIEDFEEKYFNVFIEITENKVNEIRQKNIIEFIRNDIKDFIRELSNVSTIYVPPIEQKVEPLAFAESLPVIWTEKSGIAEEITAWIKEEFGNIIPIVVGKGYDSGELVYDFFQRVVLKYKDYYRQIIIYHISDLDPTGTDIPRALQEKIKHFCEIFNIDENRVKIERLALTPEQVIKYKLPPLLKKKEKKQKKKKEDKEDKKEEYEGDPQVVEKVKRDPRFKRFEEQGYKIVCEVDAFLALRPRDFRNLVIETIKKHIDWNCYKQWKERYKAIEDALIREQREMQLQARKEKIDDISKQLERLKDYIDSLIENGKEELKKVKQELEELENKMYMHK